MTDRWAHDATENAYDAAKAADQYVRRLEMAMPPKPILSSRHPSEQTPEEREAAAAYWTAKTHLTSVKSARSRQRALHEEFERLMHRSTSLGLL